MKKLIFTCVGTACMVALSSCDTVDDDDDDDERRTVHVHTPAPVLAPTTRVTEETVRTSPYGSVQTQTTTTY